jgi:hypothetical protein
MVPCCTQGDQDHPRREALLELFQNVVIYGVSPTGELQAVADHRLIAAEMTLYGR